MEVVYECCGGLDVHAKTVVACVIKKGRKEIRTFATMTEELLHLGDWLSSEGCTHVAIESTGVYWKPVFNILGGNTRSDPGQRATYQSSAGAQNGRAGLRVARGFVTAWVVEGQFYSAAARFGSCAS